MQKIIFTIILLLISFNSFSEEKEILPVQKIQKIEEKNNLQKENLNSRELEKKTQKSADAIIFALQSLLEQDKIKILPNNKYTLQ